MLTEKGLGRGHMILVDLNFISFGSFSRVVLLFCVDSYSRIFGHKCVLVERKNQFKQYLLKATCHKLISLCVVCVMCVV